jgi:peroxiredoxin
MDSGAKKKYQMKLAVSVFFTSVLLFVLDSAPAQTNGYKYTIKVNNFQGEIAYLGYPYGDKKYLADTAEVSKDGSFVFTGEEPLDGGLYFVYSPAPNSLYFDVVVAEPFFSMETDTLDLVGRMNVDGSAENQLFFDFQRFMREMQSKGGRLSEQLKAASDPAEKAQITEQLKSLDEQVKSYRSELIENQGNTFVAKFIMSTVPIEVPESPKDENGKELDPNYGYKYYKQHYFDNIDFSDKRILRTPNFHGKIDEYLEKLTVKHPDSIIASCHTIIEKAKANEDVFRYCVQNLTYKYETSNIMGMDAVFVDLAENYYVSGDAFWADSATVAKITDRVQRMKPNLIGKQAPMMLLMDTTMKPVNAHSIKADYTVLYFYDPDCGHCKKKTPALRDLYHEKLKDMGVLVVAANIKKDMDDWKNYIKEQELDWVNLADPNMRSNFRYEYNIETTPQIFILDDQKKIIAKKLDVEQIEDFIKRQEEVNDMKQNPG